MIAILFFRARWALLGALAVGAVGAAIQLDPDTRARAGGRPDVAGGRVVGRFAVGAVRTAAAALAAPVGPRDDLARGGRLLDFAV